MKYYGPKKFAPTTSLPRHSARIAEKLRVSNWSSVSHGVHQRVQFVFDACVSEKTELLRQTPFVCREKAPGKGIRKRSVDFSQNGSLHIDFSLGRFIAHAESAWINEENLATPATWPQFEEAKQQLAAFRHSAKGKSGIATASEQVNDLPKNSYREVAWCAANPNARTRRTVPYSLIGICSKSGEFGTLYFVRSFKLSEDPYCPALCENSGWLVPSDFDNAPSHFFASLASYLIPTSCMVT